MFIWTLIYAGLLFLLSTPLDLSPHYIIFRICQMSKLSEIKMSCTICLPSFRLFVILATFSGSCAGSGASWFSWCTRSVTTICLQVKQLVVLPGYSAFFKCKEMSTVHGPRSLFLVLCPCAVCPCRCSTQISGLFIVVWLGFVPGLIPSLFLVRCPSF